jgi:hypothetical protein
MASPSAATGGNAFVDICSASYFSAVAGSIVEAP